VIFQRDPEIGSAPERPHQVHEQGRPPVKHGATLEEAEIDGAWLAAYAKIARRCRDDKDLGVSRYQFELAPGVSPFSGGYFEHRELAVRRSMERHPSLRPLLEYEANYTNYAGYCMRFSSTAMALRGEALKLEGTTEVEEAEMFDVWAMMAVRYGLRVVGLRVEFNKRSAKGPMHARLVTPVLEGQNNTPATDDLDDVMEKLDMHMAIQLRKAAGSLHATNAIKRSGDGGAAPQYSRKTEGLRDGSRRNSESSRGGCSGRRSTCAEPFTSGFWSNPPSLSAAAKS
jgi:hypothetical protein